MAQVSLCMIVKNESEVLARCLESIKRFPDEIIIVDTGSTDRTVDIAKRYTDKVYFFKWINDFAAARNFSFSKATKEYCFWLDADDFVAPSECDKMIALKPNLTKDIYTMVYDYVQDEKGKSLCLFQRERIIRNDSRFRWKYPIHECIPVITNSVETLPIIITHKRTQAGYSSDRGRNIVMLEKSLTKEEYTNDSRIRYYLAKEYHDSGRFKEAIENYEKFINMPNSYHDDYIAAHHKLANCYHVVSLNEKDVNKKLQYREKAKHWAFECIKKDYRWAESYYTLGMLSWDEQNWKQAIHWFEICRGMPKPDVWTPVRTDMYTWLPNLQLCVMYSKIGDLTKSYERNKEAMEMNPTHRIIRENDRLLKKMLQQKREEKTIKTPTTFTRSIKPTLDLTDSNVLQSSSFLTTRPIRSVKIGWLVAGTDKTIPQFRIRIYNINKQLQKEGYRSELFTDPINVGNYDVVIFDVSFEEESYNVIEQAKSMKKYVIVNVCEALFEFNNPWYIRSMKTADTVICCSESFKRLIKEKIPTANVHCIEDAVETDFSLNCKYEDKEELLVGWCGMGGGSSHAERLRPLLEKYGCKLVTIHEQANANIKWNLDTWAQDLVKCDFAIAPTDHIKQPCKSNNKLTTSMALGLPVVASPLPSYVDIVKDGETGFIAETDEQWERAFIALRNVETRKRIGEAGKRVARSYSISTITNDWKNKIFENASINSNESCGNKIKNVDIIIATYKNVPYLRECLLSIKACTTNRPYNVIVVNGGGNDQTAKFMNEEFPEFICLNSEKRLNFSEANNLGIKHSSAPYVCLMNDDVIVSKNWLQPLIEQIKDNVGIVNPLSNCSRGWLHAYDIFVGDILLGPGVQSLENGKITDRCRHSNAPQRSKYKTADPSEVYSMISPSNRTYIRDWVPFFCVIIPRNVIDTVGLLDEEFKTDIEDLDYCIRAKKLGYVSCVCESSFVLHFGAVSRKVYQKENYSQHLEENKYNKDRIKIKYDKPTIVIQTGYAFESWGPDCREKGLGGSEQWACYIAESLANLGVRVVVFAPTGKQKQIVNNVEWYDSGEWNRFIDMNYIDICIVSRYVKFFQSPIRAGKKYLFVHDIFAMGAKEDGFDIVQEQYDNLDGIFVLSDWHRDFFANYHNVPKDKLIVFGHGLDMKRFVDYEHKSNNNHT